MVTTNDQGPFTGPEGPRAEATPWDVTPTAVPGTSGTGVSVIDDAREPTTQKRTGARRILVPVAAAVVAAALGVGVTLAVTHPGADRTRNQRDTAQSQLAQANADLTGTRGRLTTAESVATGCRRLSDDSAQLVDQLAKLEVIFTTYENGQVEVGSQQDQDLNQQAAQIRSELILLRGSVASDQAICGQTPTTA